MAGHDDPHTHSANIRGMLTNVIEHAREDINKVNDPSAKALFETTAEVLIGLRTAYEHFEQESEAAWRKAG
jgi:hypothetical protein